MNHGANHYGAATVPRCPSCGPLGNVIRNGTKGDRQRYRCTRCQSQLRADDSPPKERERGTVAGKITIGRGSVWGAGLA